MGECKALKKSEQSKQNNKKTPWKSSLINDENKQFSQKNRRKNTVKKKNNTGKLHTLIVVKHKGKLQHKLTWVKNETLKI